MSNWCSDSVEGASGPAAPVPASSPALVPPADCSAGAADSSADDGVAMASITADTDKLSSCM